MPSRDHLLGFPPVLRIFGPSEWKSPGRTPSRPPEYDAAGRRQLDLAETRKLGQAAAPVPVTLLAAYFTAGGFAKPSIILKLVGSESHRIDLNDKVWKHYRTFMTSARLRQYGWVERPHAELPEWFLSLGS